MTEQRPASHASRCIDGRLVAGIEQQHAGRYELIGSQAIALVADSHERGDQIVARGGAALGSKLGPSIAANSVVADSAAFLVLRRVILLVEPHDPRRPGPKPMAFLDRASRAARRSPALAAARLDPRRSPSASASHPARRADLDERTNALAQVPDASRTERRRHEATHACVVGALGLGAG